MDIQKVNRTKHLEGLKEIQINVRITKKLSKWLKEQDVSPTALFTEACKELGYKE